MAESTIISPGAVCPCAESIVNAVRESLLVLDGQLRVVSANPSFYRTFRVTAPETIGALFYRLGNGQWNSPRLRELLEAVIPDNTQFTRFTVEHTFPSIGRKIMLLDARRMDYDGRKGYILLAIDDVTAQVQSEAKYHKFVESLNSIIIGFDKRGKINFFNRFAEKLFGYSREEMEGKDFVGTIIPRIDSTGRNNEGLAGDVLAHPEKYYINENEGVRKNGERLWFSWSAKGVRDQDGTVSEILIDGTDLTPQRGQIMASRQAYRMLDAAPDVVARISPDGRYSYVNNAMARLIGRSSGEIIGKFAGDLGMTEENRALIKKAILRVIRTKKQESIETRYGDKLFQMLLEPEFTGNGEVEAIVTFSRDITTLVSVEERYRLLYETMTQGVVHQDNTGRIISANHAALEMLGATREYFIGSSSAQEAKNTLREDGAPFPGGEHPAMVALATGKEVRGVVMGVRNPRKDQLVWIRIDAIPLVRPGEDKPYEVYTLFDDVTERLKAEKELEHSRHWFERVAVTSPNIIFVLDITRGRNVYTNDSIVRILGFTPKEYKQSGNILQQMVHPEDLPKTEKFYRDMADAGPETVRVLIQRIFHKKGNIIWLESTVGPFSRGPDGRVKEVIGIAQDITERVRAEETLRHNEYELRTLVDNSPDLIFRVNRSLQYVFANPAYERLTGIPREQFIGKTNEELGMPQRLVEFWKNTLLQVIESGRESSIEFDMAGFFGKRYFFARLIPEFASSGMVETILAVTRDITERKRAEEQIRFISFHDEVTGLFNRAYFEEEIRRVDNERNLPVSIIMGDVNNLKLTNDVFGHDEGDALLKGIAGSIRKACRQGDSVARWGGDEFAVILPGTDPAAAGEIRDRIQNLVHQSEGTVLYPSIALGIGTKEQSGQDIYTTIRRAEEMMYDGKLAESKKIQETTIDCLLEQARARTEDFSEHLMRCNELARRFGEYLGLTEDQKENLSLLIKLHDIGDAAVPPELLMKPGRLTPGEWDIVKRHSETGFRIVKVFADTARISNEVLAHGEYWDGSGYPRGLKGKDIPYLARIFLIIDAYDVMTHARPYARALSEGEGIEELCRNAGRQFDPSLTELFVARVLRKQ